MTPGQTTTPRERWAMTARRDVYHLARINGFGGDDVAACKPYCNVDATTVTTDPPKKRRCPKCAAIARQNYGGR